MSETNDHLKTILAARKVMLDAEAKFLDAVIKAFPEGAPVIFAYRGNVHEGHVECVMYDGRVKVRSDRTNALHKVFPWDEAASLKIRQDAPKSDWN